MRIMGLDFGSKTVGVAVSDELVVDCTGNRDRQKRVTEKSCASTLARIEELDRGISGRDALCLDIRRI